jgi:conjugal transfer pilus assembly protein TraV
MNGRLLLLAAALTLGGCSSMSGLGGDSKYACKAPDGVACDSVSGTYANAVANNLPGQRKRQTAQETSQTTPAPRPAEAARAGLPAADTLEPGSPLRAQARYLRLWVKPWEDADGDLYDQAHVYVQIDQGRWHIGHVQQAIRDSYMPLRPPAPDTQPSGPPQGAHEEPDAAASRSDTPRPSSGAMSPSPAHLLNGSGEVSP